MKLSLRRKGLVRIGIVGSILLVLISLGIFLFNLIGASAVVTPGNIPGILGGITYNATRGDFFFASGDQVFVFANFSCTQPSVCGNTTGNTTSATANFSSIGAFDRIVGVFKTNGTLGTTSWAVFEFNATVNGTNTSGGYINLIAPKTILVNATAGNGTGFTIGAFHDSTMNTTILLVNMSTPPSCPPSDVPLPPAIPLLNGTIVNIGGCWSNCTVNDRAQFQNSTPPGYYQLCGMNFGGTTTNFTDVATNGNFSNFNFVLDIPGKVKINFTTNVSMDNQTKAQALFQFAMKNVMTGGKIGVNDSEWDGSNPNVPVNLNLSARLTLNVSGLPITGVPQIVRSAFGTEAAAGTSCSPSICQNLVWNGENITFTVSSFSDYGLQDGINVTLTAPANFSFISGINSTRNINFTFTPTWNGTMDMKNCTLYGNFTGAASAFNATNTTKLVNGTVNGINNTVSSDGPYQWTSYCYDVTGSYDYASPNQTVTIDTVAPVLNSTIPANNSYARPEERLFQINVTDTNLNVSNVTLRYNRTGTTALQNVSLTCTGAKPSFVCNNTVNLNIYADGNTIRYYFEASDNASLVGSNGTITDGLLLTIDSKPPTYLTNVTSKVSGTNYTKDGNYGFQINWTDARAGLSMVIFEFNGVNYTNASSPAVQNISNQLFWINFTDRAAGTYAYRWFANDTLNNSNSTPSINFEVAKGVDVITVKLRNSTDEITNNDMTVTYNSSVNITGIPTSPGGPIIWRNSTDVSSTNKTNVVYAAGDYEFKVNTSGNANYTANATGITVYVSVKKVSPTASLTLVVNETVAGSNTTTYPNVVTFKGNSSIPGYEGLTYTLYRNNVSNATGNPATFSETLGNDTTHNITYATGGGTNYTAGQVEIRFVVLKGDNPVTLYFRNATNEITNNNMTVTYNASVNVTGTITSPGGPIIWRNSTDVSSTNRTNIVYAAGVYAFKVNASSTTNYTANNTGATYYLTVNKVAPNLTLTIDGSNAASQTRTYPNQTTAQGSETNVGDTDVSYTLLRGGSLVSNPETVRLGNATYNYTYNTTGGENFTATQTEISLTVLKGTAINLVLYLNGTSVNKTYEYPAVINITGWKNVTDESLALYRNGSAVPVTTISGTNGTIQNITYSSLNLGIHNFTLNLSAATNFTDTTVYLLAAVQDTVAPVLNSPIPADNTYITGSSTELFQINVTDQTLNLTNATVRHRLQGAEAWTAVSLTCTGARPYFTCNANIGLSGIYANGEVIQYYFAASDNATLGNSTSNNIGYNGTTASPLQVTVDRGLPLPLANYTSKVSGTQFIPNQNYGFQVNWSNVNFKNSTFEFNGTNYTSLTTPAVQNTSETFWINFTDLPAWSNYTYRWYGIDSAGNQNSTPLINYSVAQNQTNILDIYFRNSTGEYKNQNTIITYTSNINVTVVQVYPRSGTANLTRNTTITDEIDLAARGENNTNTVLGAGVYAYKINITGNANYTTNATGATYYLTVNKADNIITVIIRNSTNEITNNNMIINYTERANITGYSLGGAISIFRNGTSKTGENTTNVFLDAAVHEIKINSTTDANYTTNATGATYYLTVNKISPVANMSLTIDGSSASTQTRNYLNTSATATSETNALDFGVGYTLSRNGTDKGTSETILLGTGVHNYTYNTSGNANYTEGSKEIILTVNKGTPTNFVIYIDNDPSTTQTRTHPNQTNITGTMSTQNSQGSLDLYIDNVIKASGNTSVTHQIILGNGTAHNITLVYNTTANYTITQNESTLVILKATNASAHIYLSFNGTVNESRTYGYEQFANVTGYKDMSEGNLTLYRNDTAIGGTQIQQPNETVRLGNATYNYTLQYLSENYTATNISFIVTVTKKNLVIYTAFNTTTNGNATYEYEQFSNATGYTDTRINNEGTLTLYRNNSAVSGNTETVRLGNATYNYTLDFTATNYTNNQTTYWITVTKKSININLYLNDTEANRTYTYPGVVNVSANRSTTVNDEGTLTILRDGISNATGTSRANFTSLLVNGTYNFSLTVTATNYTATAITTNRFASILKGGTTVTLYINSNSANASVPQGNTTNFTATVNATYNVQLNLTINITNWGTRSGSNSRVENVTDTTTVTVANYYNVTAYFGGDQNFSASSQTYWLNVTQDASAPTLLLPLYVNGTIRKSTATLTLNISVSDVGTGVTGNCTVTIGGSFAGNITSSSGWCNGTVTVPSGLSDGNGTLNVSMGDVQGNVGSNSTYTVTIDNTAPTLTVITPTNASYVNVSTDKKVWVNGTVYDMIAMGIANVSVNDTRFTISSFNGGNNTAFNISNTSAVSDGYVTLKINYADNATNTGNATIYFTVDNTAPSVVVGITNSTNNGAYRPNSSEQVRVTITDAQTNATIFLNYRTNVNNTWVTVPMTGTPGATTVYTANIDTSDLTSDGQWVRYYINGIDNATNSIPPSVGGNQSSPLGNLNISVYCGNSGIALKYCSYDEGWQAVTTGALNQYHRADWLKEQLEAASSLSSNYNISNVLSSISGKFSYVYHYNRTSGQWVAYDPNILWSLNTLRFGNNTNSTEYWINVTSSGAIIRIV